MEKLKPHIHLEKINELQYQLSAVIDIESGLELVTPAFPVLYGQKYNDPNGNSVTETFLQMVLKGTPVDGIITLRYAFLLDVKEILKAKDIRVRLKVKHDGHGADHDGTSSAHYGDPTP